MNIIKNKQRNRMKLTLLKSILKIRCGIQLMGKCYNNYEIPLNLIKQIGTKESYQSDKDNKGDYGNVITSHGIPTLLPCASDDIEQRQKWEGLGDLLRKFMYKVFDEGFDVFIVGYS
ncbi:unnamed protein product [Parnassius apollo]|uniref:(apollo) hypothetical protein n=1 Tax=Parnassius apollo TaxID=110799 RepID=A0A8S3XN09_PARAO|nr:unnamed protein product [Parnassius apollo]